MEWFYAKDGRQEGPVDLATLQAKLQSGELSPGDLIWREGMAEWTPADKVPEVTPGAAPAAPAAAPAPAPEAAPAPAAATAPVADSSPAAAVPAAPVATSGLAIASLVCGIVALIACYVHALFALPAIICGHIAMKKIRAAPETIGGKGMAIAGLVMGYISLLLQVATIIFVVAMFRSASGMQEEMQRQMEEALREQAEQQQLFEQGQQ